MGKKYDLPNGCSRTEIEVTPSTWLDRKSFNADKEWRIHYTFYDAEKNLKRVQVKGMNDITNWKDRWEFTDALIEKIETALDNGFNPITKKYVDPATKVTTNKDGVVEITEESSMLDTFKYGLSKAKKRVTPGAFKDLEIVVNFIGNHVDTSDFKAKDIRRKNMVKLLERIEEAKINKEGQFSNNNFNHFRKYLGILCGELIEDEIIEFNPIDEYLKKRNHVVKEREVLTEQEKELVKEHLKKTNYLFYRYVALFFHSGSRNTELMTVQGKMVDLVNQKFKVMVLKGGSWTIETRTIKDDALPLWEELMSTCEPEDYIFSKRLKPGKVRLNAEGVTDKWNRHVKKKLGINKDLYSLKHLHSLEMTKSIADQLKVEADELKAIEQAQEEVRKHNGHKTTKMLDTHYTQPIRRLKEEIVHQRIKKSRISF